MLKKFLAGGAFGAGFAAVFLVVVAGAARWGGRGYSDFSLPTRVESLTTESFGPTSEPDRQGQESNRDWSDIPMSERIEKSAAIVVANYEASGGCQFNAVVTEVLKRDQAGQYRYEIGDRVGRTFCVEPGTRQGDGAVVFLSGDANKASRYSVTFTNGRIHRWDDLPLSAFRERVAESVSKSIDHLGLPE